MQEDTKTVETLNTATTSLSPFHWPIASEGGTAMVCMICPYPQDVGDPNPLDRHMHKEETRWHP
jgi:hypothetical protein